MSDHTIRELGEEAIRELRGLRDDLQLKAHLAGMDAKEAWSELTPHVKRIEDILESGVRGALQPEEGADDQARLQAHLAFMEARERWREVEPHVQPLVNAVRKAGDTVTDSLFGAAEKARLQTALASMEAKDAWQHKRDELEKAVSEGLEEARAKTRSSLQELLDAVRDYTAIIPPPPVA